MLLLLIVLVQSFHRTIVVRVRVRVLKRVRVRKWVKDLGLGLEDRVRWGRLLRQNLSAF